ncbi:MAG: D-2-hydroxyacid dehydrogenase [Clostridiaceae bacterium]|nr:D-2-hydroxyacid dehydrogenase [Clostridiaceae bacterium]
MPKTVILDGYTTNPGDLSWDWLREYGELEVYDLTSPDEVVGRTRDADIVITNKTPLPKPVIEQMQKVKFIALLSTGYNVVDCEYARQRGIPVSNIPTYSTMAVAQLVFAYISEFCNGVALHSQDVRNGGWTASPHFCYWKQPLLEMNEKTIGIVGFGKIGQAVANIAEAYNMKILACSGHETDQSGRKNFRWASLDEIAANADFITFHTPLTPKTEKMLGADFLSKCKPSAFVINTSRGPVVDEQALADALNSDRIAGAAVDVLSVEPARADNPLLTAKNCYITPHIAWAGFETRQRLMSVLKENFRAFAEGHPINVVNK